MTIAKYFFVFSLVVYSNNCLCSVGCNGICWAVDKKDTVWRRLGAKVNLKVAELQKIKTSLISFHVFKVFKF